MAEELQHILDSKESVCTFYTKLGVCRRGNDCTRIHPKRCLTQTLILKNFYMVPLNVKDEDEYYESFYEDVLGELINYGDVQQFCICENIADHTVC